MVTFSTFEKAKSAAKANGWNGLKYESFLNDYDGYTNTWSIEEITFKNGETPVFKCYLENIN